MAIEHNRSRLAGLRGVEAGVHMHRRAEAARAAARGGRSLTPKSPRSDYQSSAWWHSSVLMALWWQIRQAFGGQAFGGPTPRLMRSKWVRRTGIGLASIAALCAVVAGGLWLLLASGPISFDFATPWLTAAIAENFGDQFRVEIGGTVLERDEHGRTAMRIRGITVRDRDGAVIASAPKAEVGFSSASLFSGRPRAERLNLVGAELAVRVEADGKVTVSTGSDQRPLATAPALAAVGSRPAPASGAMALGYGNDRAADAKRTAQESFAAFLAWVDSLGALGLDGGDLTEVGLKSGNLVVDDRRNGQQSRFENIHLSLTRPRAGSLELKLGSEDAARPWLLVASVKPGTAGSRLVDVEAQKIMLKDLLLAMRVDGGQIETDAPITTAVLRAEIAQDGTPQVATGHIVMGPGSFVDAGDPEARIAIDRAEVQLDWNGAQHTLTMPFQVVSGGTRMTLTAQAESPRDANGVWGFNLGGGSVVLAPTSPGEEPLVLNRILVRCRIDSLAHRLNIDQAEVAGKGVGVAMSGNLDFSGSDPRINIGMVTRKLSLAAFKQMWPAMVTPAVRTWVIERVSGGTIEQGELATNAPLSTLRSGGPPVPDDGLTMQVITSGATVRPFDNLPDIRDADLVTRVKGRTSTVTLGRGVVEMPTGRKLTLANGVFEVPDTSIKNPPAKVRARVEGPVAAAAELLGMDRLKDAAGVPIDPATSRGNVLATINLALPLNTEVKSSTLTYAITADIVNFSADRFLMSQKVEAQTLRASANNQGYQIKGDMRIGGAPASVELRRASGDPDAEVRLTSTLDDAARARFGLDAGGAIVGPIPLKVGGRVAFSGDQDSRLLIEADLTQTKLDNPFPGWVKAQNRPAKATFTYVGRGKPTRLDDVTFDGNGASLRGSVEFDQNGDFAVATFPVFALSDGDKSNLRLERTPDNLYKVTVRGDTFDGRNFVKSSMSGTEAKQRRPALDIDIDAKVGAVAGFKGEVLRNLDLHLTRRGGVIRNLAVNARFAGEGALQGELRGRPGERQIVYIESNDAGALFRFSDVYSKMVGGQMWIAMDPPTHDGAKQDGLIDVREFAVRGEAALDGIAAGAPNGVSNGVGFSRMRVEFTRAQGKMSIHEGLVTGPTIGATIDGVMDYPANEVHLRGTFVPLYGLNTAFQQIPIVGVLLGDKGGLIGSMTYEVVGSPGQPVLRVNPISMVMPGILRKFMEFPSSLPGDRFPAPAANGRER
jgi:Protein of unknown function